MKIQMGSSAFSTRDTAHTPSTSLTTSAELISALHRLNIGPTLAFLNQNANLRINVNHKLAFLKSDTDFKFAF